MSTFFHEQRRRIGLTQVELADRLGVSWQCVSAWDRGFAAPRRRIWKQLARIFKVSLEEIAVGCATQPRPKPVKSTRAPAGAQSPAGPVGFFKSSVSQSSKGESK